MKRPQEIAVEEATMGSMVQLTSVFEGIASMRIGQIKNQVEQSQKFFNELWNIYTQLRVGSEFGYGRTAKSKVIDKELLVIITGEGGFSGDIDQKLINLVRKQHDKSKQDIVVIGHHGAVQLAQYGIGFVKYFKMPSKDKNINTSPLAKEVQKYRETSVYYQSYISLMVQDVKRIELGKAVSDRGMQAAASNEEISERTYIFEPSTYAVVDHLENSMVQITLSQVILESKLAQYASRFRAMSAAHTKADESFQDLHLLFNRAKRAVKDERLKEIINGLRQVGAGI